MTALVTVLIPYTPLHKPLSVRAIESIKCQSVKCDWIAGESPKTPAVLRNHALEVASEFVVFLDADDWLEPDFVEQCLEVYQEGHYVYTGYYMGHQVVTPPACNPFAESNHLVTTLYPTEAFKYLGGFDEYLPGSEDMDFYLRSAQVGVCGLLCDKPLLHYTGNGQRSESYALSPFYIETQDLIWQRNGGKGVAMSCCGQPGQPANSDPGEKLEGDVLVESLWAGKRKEVGHVTGRVYRGGNRDKIWVARQDVEAMPSLFRPVPDVKKMSPTRAAVLKASGLLDDVE